MKYLKKFATKAEYEAYMADNMENYPHVGYIADEGAVEYVKEAPPRPERMPLHFEAIEDMTVSFSTNAIEYSLDNETWQTLPAATATPTISAGSKVYFRANGLTPTSSAGIGVFSATGKFNAVGNVMSMVYGAEFFDKTTLSKQYALARLFYACANIIDASNMLLPATTLSKNCYQLMFGSCTSLISAPSVLPALTLTSYCYVKMFYECEALVNAPAIHALTLADNCCFEMFRNCKSLVTAPILLASTLVNRCYEGLFKGCSKLNYIKAMFIDGGSFYETEGWVQSVAATGTFVKHAAATWDRTGNNGVPTGWTVETATE